MASGPGVFALSLMPASQPLLSFSLTHEQSQSSSLVERRS